MAPSDRSSHLAGANELERWADMRSAQADLPILVRRLVRTENDQVQRIEMRGGEGVGLTGFDGFVEATRSTSFVPGGLSVWEMGVGVDPEKKAQSDYRTRTKNSNGIDRANTTFVFVTPRRWEKKKEWEQRRRAEKVWRDVRVLDGDDIEQALELAPAVQIWLSELLGMDPFGATSIEDWWERFARGFRPALTRPVVLAGRENQAAALSRRLIDEVGRTYIRAASIDDGLAFAACAMMTLGPDDSEPVLARSILVHDSVTLRRLERTSNLLILLPYEEHLHRDAHLIGNHHVVFVVTDNGGEPDIELPPLDHLALRSALSDAGVPDGDLDRYMRAGNKSLVALRRVSTHSRDPEAWRAELEDRTLRRAWLAGAWSQTRSGDSEAISALAGTAESELEERLAVAARQPDPIFTKVGTTWAVASPEDSWRVARQSVRDADLNELERTIQTVLGAVDPRLDLPAQDRWLADVHGKRRIHSSDLRKGLARSMALLGARGDELRLSGGRTARQWAERVSWNLFERATQDQSAQLWISMEDVVPLLAESAPDPFLRAFSATTNGIKPLAGKFFQDANDEWNAASPHTGFLWALEGLAWSEQYMGYAAEVLARLAEIDPGGRLSNRPAGSLESIFRPWYPQTSAPLVARIQTLDALVRRHANVAWTLLLGLLPEDSEFVSQSHRPVFRKWAGTREPRVPWSEYLEMIEAVSARLIGIATDDPSRWKSLLPKLHRLAPGPRQTALRALTDLEPPDLGSDDRLALWSGIDGLVRKHRAESDAVWSLDSGTLDTLEVVLDRIKPKRSSDAHRWLFDEWNPRIGISRADGRQEYNVALSASRLEAVSVVHETEGLEGLLRLASGVRFPSEVGRALAEVKNNVNDEAVLALMDGQEPSHVRLSEGFAQARLAGDSDRILVWVEHFSGRSRIQARLLQYCDDVMKVWNSIANYGPEVDRAYWAEFSPFGRGADFPFVSEAVRQLIAHGRVAMAIDTLSIYGPRESGVDVDLVVEALEALGKQEDPEAELVSDYDISKLFDFLREEGLDDDAIAVLEWRYLPLLHDGSRILALEKVLAANPETFTRLVELVFRRRNEESDELRRGTNPVLAANAYRLLREWKVVPGTREDRTVDGTALSQWLEEARRLLVDLDRAEVGELQIGEVLAHSPEDPDGTFPTLAVRDQLEAAPDDRLERGFAIGLYNKRGVTSRGLTDGGQQEYDLADKYENWANAIQTTHPRTAATLRGVAAGYREEGRRNDEEVKRYLEGLDNI